jgi:hypothetical protein
MKKDLTYAGEYQLYEVGIQNQEGISYDISAQIVGIAIYEDLFSPFITGSLYVSDAQDLPGIFGRAGMDILRLKIGTPSLDKSKNIDGLFHIYKVDDRMQAKERLQTYTIRFISIESLFDQKRISKHFRGNSVNIISNILSKELTTKKKFNYTQSSNEVSFVSNFWTPMRCVAFCTEHALKKDGVSNFLFYENREGFNFFNISDIQESSVIQSFSNFNQVAKPESSNRQESVSRDIELDYRNVQEIYADKIYDYIDDYDSGMIKSRMYLADPILKKYYVKDYSISNDKTPLLNKNLPYTNNVIGLTTPLITTKTRHYNQFDVGDSTNYSILQQRIAQLKKFRWMTIEIEVFGRTDYTVGKKVYLDANKLREITKDERDIQDKWISGYYIIAAVAHKFSTEEHYCTIELIKDSTLLP